MIYILKLYRSPDSSGSAGNPSKYEPEQSESLEQTRQHEQPVTSSPGEAPYTGSHAESFDPEQNAPDDGPSGENTKTGADKGGGLYTSGGQVTTGTPYHDED